MRSSAILVTLLLTAGCATDQEGWSGLKTPFVKPVATVSYPIGEFSLFYADIKAAYVLLAGQVTAACRAQVIGQEACEAAKDAQVRIETLDESIRNSIRNPGTQTDWPAVGRAVRTITSLAVSLGVPGGGAIVKIPELLGGAGGVVERLRPQSYTPPLEPGPVRVLEIGTTQVRDTVSPAVAEGQRPDQPFWAVPRPVGSSGSDDVARRAGAWLTPGAAIDRSRSLWGDVLETSAGMWR